MENLNKTVWNAARAPGSVRLKVKNMTPNPIKTTATAGMGMWCENGRAQTTLTRQRGGKEERLVSGR